MKWFVSKTEFEKGLTLIEVILSIVIFSMVASLIFRFLDFGISSFSFGNEQIDENASLRMVALRITEESRNAFDVEVSDTVPIGDQSQYIYFDTVADAVVYNDSSTVSYLSPKDLLTDASFQIKAKTADEVDGNGVVTGTVTVGYVLAFELESENSALSSEVLLNNVSGGTVTSDLDTARDYVGFNHDTP